MRPLYSSRSPITKWAKKHIKRRTFKKRVDVQHKHIYIPIFRLRRVILHDGYDSIKEQ